jgi:uncharacterized protein with PIN domain
MGSPGGSKNWVVDAKLRQSTIGSHYCAFKVAAPCGSAHKLDLKKYFSHIYNSRHDTCHECIRFEHGVRWHQGDRGGRMATATFRFYGELNDFLAPARRQRAFACPCAQNATAKHMIEALGVPHTEVELILVAGEPAPFDRLLRDGERVAAYPRFAAFDVAPMAGLRAPLPPVRRFVADAHLGGLARLLRMAGFDTLYDNHIDDDVLAAIAIGEQRIALTRDRELLKRRGIVHGRYVHALRPAEQLIEILDRFGLAPHAAPFTLCLHCNAPLRPVDKARVIGQLPESVRVHHQEFSTCDLCRRVYWKGSHWQRMTTLLAAALGAGDQGASM